MKIDKTEKENKVIMTFIGTYDKQRAKITLYEDGRCEWEPVPEKKVNEEE